MGIRLRYTCLFFPLLFLASCTETESPEEQLNERFGVESIVVSGENKAQLRIIPLNESAELYDIEMFDVSIQGPDGTFELDYIGDNMFRADESEITVFADALYRLKLSGESAEITAQVETPPAFDAIDSPGNLISPNPNLPDEILALISWENPGDYLFVLKLEFLGINPDPIPFDGPSGLFYENFAFPIPELGIPLYANYFSDYGPHRLTIYAVSEEYSSYFYPENNGLLPLLNSNVFGAFGYMAGLTSIKFEFDVSN